MGNTISCSCCNNDEKMNQIQYGEKQYKFKLRVN